MQNNLNKADPIKYKIQLPDGRTIIKQRIETGEGKTFRYTPAFSALGISLRDLPLYGLEKLNSLREGTEVWFVEGEECAKRLNAMGVTAVSGYWGSSQKDFGDSLKALMDFRVICWPDNDDAGKSYMSNVARQLSGENSLQPVQWVDVESMDLNEKDDVVDYLNAGRNIGEVPYIPFREWIPPTPPTKRATGSAGNAIGSKEQSLRDQAEFVFKYSSYADAEKEAIPHLGFEGSTDVVELISLAVSSRHTERPMNVAVIAQSAAGKGMTIETALKMHPDEAVITMSASSERSFVYSDKLIKNRVLYWKEADSLPDDGAAISALRAMIEDDNFTYEYVSEGLKPKTIEKEGPTGFLTSSTKPLPPQLGTRVIEVSIEESTDLTRKVISAAFAAASAPDKPNFDTKPFKAFHRMIQEYGQKEAILPEPIASKLASHMNNHPNLPKSMQRHVKKVIQALKTSAIREQFHRPQSDDGCLRVSKHDYEVLYRTYGPQFTRHMHGGLSDSHLQVYHYLPASDAENGKTRKDLETELNLPTSTVRSYVQLLLKKGYAACLDDKKRPQTFRQGEPLEREEQSVLPTPDELWGEQSEC